MIAHSLSCSTQKEEPFHASMKIQSSVAVVLVALAASGSALSPQKHAITKHTVLLAKKDWWSPVATAAVGWTLATQIASASMPRTSELVMTQDTSIPTWLLSVKGGKVSEWFAPEAEKAYEKIDFSMPSYGSTSFGFGEGQEGEISKEKGGGTEAELQAEAVKKAEAARQARLEEKREALKRREAEDRARAEAKKAEARERISSIFQ